MSRTNKRAQTSFEFLILVGVALAALLLFASLSLRNLTELQNEKDFLLIREAATAIHTELVLAAQVEDGYTRSFAIPGTINNKEYDIVVVNETLTLSSAKATYFARIPQFSGTLNKGQNTVTKIDGQIRVNMP